MNSLAQLDQLNLDTATKQQVVNLVQAFQLDLTQQTQQTVYALELKKGRTSATSSYRWWHGRLGVVASMTRSYSLGLFGIVGWFDKLRICGDCRVSAVAPIRPTS